MDITQDGKQYIHAKDGVIGGVDALYVSWFLDDGRERLAAGDGTLALTEKEVAYLATLEIFVREK